ncbi:S8 family peptidase [Dactylosporangium sp. CA-092794]|uniref:S8 family peptidase n=1 Tax=Dactylosporangium sp. CA-092794 TaxID=3239929 RepID=UPI003D91A068
MGSATRIRAAAIGAAAVAVATALAALPASASPATGTVYHAGSGTAVDGSYLVVLRDGRVDHGRATALTARYGGGVTRVYGHAVPGYAANLTAAQAARLAADPAVDRVEADQVVRVADTQAYPPSWGLDRIDQRQLPLNASYEYGPSAGVTVYVIDTGVRINHPDFGGRAAYGYDAVDGDSTAQDGNGHGTFVAGVAAGARFGVAKSARIVAVRVLDDNGSGTTAGVIAGIDWVTEHAAPGESVANLSLSGGVSPTLDAAVLRSIDAGITYTIAAGNAGADAANASPARVGEALTVGATDRTDTRPSWSNYGSAVDLFAPGVDITSDWRTAGTYTASGTSFSAPHVAGAAALYLDAHPGATPETVEAAITAAATAGAVADPGTGSPNLLLYTGS